MNENDVFGIDKVIFSECMLERGYYPENLPPVFSIANFWEAANPHLQSKSYTGKKTTEPSVFNASKRGGARRKFEMPNPTFMIDSAIFYCEYRSNIFEHFQTSDDSLSVPIFNNDGRPARISSHSEFHKIRRQKLATSRYIVRADISRYYHSIYTHSIPWALHGKAESKKDRKPESTAIFGNRLDQIFRNAKDGQTVGIPVGPDFSRYGSEIIGKAIDKKFREQVGDQYVLIRHVDDIFVGVDDYDDANRILNAVQESVRGFELDVNENKTNIVPTNLDLEPFWTVSIRREIEGFSKEEPKSSNSRVGHDFVYFLDEILRIANTEKDDGVIKYALRQMDKLHLWKNYWNWVEPFLVRSAINYPHCWDYISRIASWRSRTHGIDESIWGAVISKTLARQAVIGNDSEVVWALWLAKEAKISVSLEVYDAILDRCGALSNVIALDVFQSISHRFSFPKSKLIDRLGDSPMLGSDWLLSYEADRLFGYKLKSKNLNNYSIGSDLYDNDTEFYERDAVPVVFDGVDDPTEVEAALEEGISFYDDNDENENKNLVEF